MASPVSSLRNISPTSPPAVIVSVGAPLVASMVSMSSNPALIPTSSRQSFITSLPSSQTITVVVSQPSNSSLSSPPPANTPTNNSTSVSNDSSTSVDFGNTNTQSFPIGLIAGIVTGFSILMLVMAIMFAILWRHKKIKVVGDTEATQMRDQRSAARAYYMPPPPIATAALHQQHKTIESEETTPVRATTRFPPEVATPRRGGATSPPRRSSSADLNKPWPPMPRAPEGVTHASAPNLREGIALGGRIINHPDPLRANGLATPATVVRAVPFTPSNAALLQLRESSSSPSPGDDPSSLFPHKDISPPSADSRGGDGAVMTCNDGTSGTPSRKETVSRNRQHDSELTRADSTAQSHFALSPPPRRTPQSSDSEANKNKGEGRLSRTPGLRLSGVSQGTIEPVDEAKEQAQREGSVDGSEADPMLQRSTWYGEGKGGRHQSGSVMPPRAGRRRFSQ